MTWTVDGVELSTLAFNVSNRDASWHVPGRRGENLSIPGRHGALYVPNKPFDVGTISLTMWALGADPLTGLVPLEGSSAQQCRHNLDKLTALFGTSHRLIEVQRVDGAAFLTKNTVTNPNQTSVDYADPAYYNWLPNPVMTGRGRVAQYTNLFPNPSFRTALNGGAFAAQAENLSLDPINKLGRDHQGSPASAAVNSAWPGSYETFSPGTTVSSTYWVTATNTTATVQTASAADQTANPTLGIVNFRVLTTAALALNASLGTTRAAGWFHFNGNVATTAPMLRLRIRRTGVSTTARTIQVRCVSLTGSGGTAVTTSGWSTATTIPISGTWTDMTFVPVMTMSGAGNYLRWEFRTGEAWTSGDGILIDGFTSALYYNNIGTGGANGPADIYAGRAINSGIPIATPPPFFDGASPWGGPQGGATYGSLGGIDTVRNTWSINPDSRWTCEDSNNANGAYYAFTDRPVTDTTGTVLGFVAMGNTGATGTQAFTTPLAAPTAGRYYRLGFSTRGPSGTNTQIEVQKMGTGDTGWTTVIDTGQIAQTGSPSAVGSYFNSGNQNGYPTGTYLAQSGDQLRLRVTVPVRTDGYHSAQVWNIGVTTALGGSYSGDTANSDNTTFTWSGTPYNSKTIISQRQPKRVLTSGGTGNPAWVTTITPDFFAGPYPFAERGVQATGIATSLDFEPVPVTASALGRGVRVSLLATSSLSGDATANSVANPTARLDVKCLDSSSNVLQTTSGSNTSVSAQPTTTAFGVSVANIPAATDTIAVSLTFITPVRGQLIEATRLLIADTAKTISFFEGITGNTSYAWTGTANDSTSENRILYPLGYQGGPNSTSDVASTGFAAATGAPGMVVSLRATLPVTGTAQQYAYGFAVAAQVEDSSGNAINLGTPAYADAWPIDVSLALYSGTTLRQTIALGTVPGRDYYPYDHRLTGSFVATNTFTEARLVFTAQTIPTAAVQPYQVSCRMSEAYLYDVALSPAQILTPNQIDNPNFVQYDALWRTKGGSVTGGTDSDPIGLPGGVTIMSSPIAATAGQSVAWALRTNGAVSAALRFVTAVANNVQTSNPVLAAASTYWTAGGTGTVSRVAASGPSGEAIARFTPTATISNGAGLQYSATADPTMTASPGDYGAVRLAVRTSIATRIAIYIQYLDASSATLATSNTAVVTGANTWSELTHYTPTAAPAGTVRARVLAYLVSGTGSVSLTTSAYIDATRLQFLRSSQPFTSSASYFDGDTADTGTAMYRWVGADSATGTPGKTGGSAVATFTASPLNLTAGSGYTDSSAVTAPAGTLYAVLALTGQPGGGTVEATYAAVPAVTRSSSIGRYEPDRWEIFDPDTGADPWGQAAGYESDQYVSRSVVQPTVPSGWNIDSGVVNVNRLGSPYNAPLGSYGTDWVAGVPRIPVGTTRTLRTTGFVTMGKPFVSGSISMRSMPGATVTFNVRLASTPYGSGSIVYTDYPSQNGSQIVFKDLATGGQDFVYFEIIYTEGQNANGYRIYADRLQVTPTDDLLGSDYPGYFDGSTNSSQWDGNPDDSMSSYFGGGRRALAEVVDAVDFTSMAGGTRAEFGVEMVIPSAFWEDLLLSTITFPVTVTAGTVTTDNGDDTFPLTVLADSTAPISDALLTLTATGTVTDFQITDVNTGAWIKISGNLATTSDTVINNDLFKVSDGTGSLISRVTRGGSNQMLPITANTQNAPSLAFSATGTGQVTVTVVAHNRYLVA